MYFRNRMSLAALAAGALAMSTIAVAQQREQPRQPNESQEAQPERRTITPGAQRETAGDASKADAQLAACLIIGNNKEVALAQFAQQHAQDPGVKEFAQQMSQDHEQCAAELQKFAEQGGYREQQLAVRGTETDRATDRRNNRAQPTMRSSGVRRVILARSQRSGGRPPADGRESRRRLREPEAGDRAAVAAVRQRGALGEA